MGGYQPTLSPPSCLCNSSLPLLFHATNAFCFACCLQYKKAKKDLCHFLKLFSANAVLIAKYDITVLQIRQKLLLLFCFFLFFCGREDLENLTPDLQAMMSAKSSRDVRGVIVTLQGTVSNGCLDANGTAYDFYSRYFAPWVGIPEDPVTGKVYSLNWHSQAPFTC